MKLRKLSLLFLGLILTVQASGQIKRANRLKELFAFNYAIPKYEKWLEKHPSDIDAIQSLADCYRLVNNSDEAEEYYRVLVQQPEPDTMNLYYMGRALMNNGKYVEAKKYFNKYLKRVPDDYVAKEMLWACDNHRLLMKDSTLFQVRLTEINSEDSDFSTAFHEDKLVFASARHKRGLIFNWTGTSFLDLYEVPYQYDGDVDPEDVKSIPGTVNTRYHESNAAFSPDDQTIYFTRNNFTKGIVGTDDKGTVLLKTYVAERKGKKWKKDKEFLFNDEEFSTGHPALTVDGSRMFFTSDMPGGFGGTDIWVTDYKNDGWSKPYNLGEKINSPGDEMFPWVDSLGVLYFASNGHHGLGGLDIYFANPASNGTFFDPVNLGYPINTPADDFSLVWNHRKDVGFFTSNRKGGVGDDDIYTFIRKHKLIVIVKDAQTKERIDSATVHVNYHTDHTDAEGEYVRGVDLGEQYEVSASKEGYLAKDEKVRATITDPDQEATIVVIELDRCSECELVNLSGSVVQKQENRPAPGTKLRIVYEETVTVDENGEFELELPKGLDYKIYVDDPTVKEPINISTREGFLPPNNVIPVEVMLGNFEVGDVFFIIYYDFDMSNIRRDASFELDRVIEFMQKYPNTGVELTSHTDSRGSDPYNETLSRKRAQEAFQYIITKGEIDKSRLKYKWAGERQLTNKCANDVECSDEEHQMNRRTEFVITKK